MFEHAINTKLSYFVSHLFTAKDTSCHCSTVQSTAGFKVSSTRTQELLEFMGHTAHTTEALVSESDHHHSMVVPRAGKTTRTDIAVSDRFHFEHAHRSRYFVKGTVEAFQQSEDLLGLAF
jgi:hypothetical protein